MEKTQIVWAASTAAVALVAYALGVHGWSEEGVRTVVRHSAQIGVVIFSATFAASSLRALWRSGFSAWALRNRRYTGLSFAVFHFLHLSALLALAISFPEPFVGNLEAATIIFGGAAYALLLGQTVTSNDTAVRRMGRARWTRLHVISSYALWIIFVQSYLPRALQDPFYVPFVLVLFTAFGLRMARRVRSKRRAAAPA